MTVIKLRDDLRKTLEQYAEHQNRSVDQLINEAIRNYIEDIHARELAREQQAYESMHTELLRTHAGKWVAVHRGSVVDSDEDDVALHQRVLGRLGDVPVLLTRVEDKPITDLWLRSPRLGPSTP